MSDSTQSFAAAYDELQQLTQEFESGNLDLEVAIPKFKRAAELAKHLKKRLTELENEIKEVNIELEQETTKPEIAADTVVTDDITF